MAFTRIRERETRTKSTYSIQTKLLNGDWSVAASGVHGPFKSIGSHQIVYDNGKTLPPRPGQVVVNPVCMHKVNSECLCADQLVYKSPYATTTRYPSWRMNGQWFEGEHEPGGSYPASPTGIEKRLAEIVSQKACAKQHEPSVDLGVFIREADLTLKMLVDPFRKLLPWLNRLRKQAAAGKVVPRGKRFDPKRDADALAGAWLQYRYGIVPLMFDIDDIISSYEKNVVKQTSIIERSTAGLPETKGETTTKYTQLHSSGWWRMFIQKSVKTSVKVTGHVYWLRKNPHSFRGGGSFEDLASYLWETLPYSFVVDWMFSVGTWLRSIQIDDEVEYVANCVTQKTVIETSYYLTGGYESTFGLPIPYAGDRVTYLEERLVRVANVQIPVTPVYLGRPLGINRTIDALTLTWQMMPKLR